MLLKQPERHLDRHARLDVIPQHGQEHAKGDGHVVAAVVPQPRHQGEPAVPVVGIGADGVQDRGKLGRLGYGGRGWRKRGQGDSAIQQSLGILG